MGIETVPHLPIVETLLPVTFGYSLSSEAVVMRQLRRWKGRDEGYWHANTRGLPWGLPEVVGTVKQVHCSRRRLFRRGLEFHERTINKSAHTKKSLETYLIILVRAKKATTSVHWLFSQFSNPQWLKSIKENNRWSSHKQVQFCTFSALQLIR